MYTPIVARLEDVSPIPGADRIVSATASGYQLVVGAEHKAGELGVVFPSEGVLDVQFALAAGLLREHPTTGEKLDGYLDPNSPRVRNLTLRGVRTGALWLPLDAFKDAVLAATDRGDVRYAFDNTTAWHDGAEVAKLVLWSIPGSAERIEFVPGRKYLPPRTREARAKTPRDESLTDRLRRARRAMFAAAMPEHYQTPPAYRALHHASYGAVVWVTDKLHGTSFRVAAAPLPLGRAKRAINRLARLFGRQPFATHEVVHGTRRTVMLPSLRPTKREKPDMRADVRDWLAPKLRPGEVVYGELVGYDATGKPVQVQRIKNADKATGDRKELIKKWGEEIVYSYGCAPDGEMLCDEGPPFGCQPRYRVFIYRIVLMGKELPFEEMRRRTLEIGAECPPLLATWRHVAPMAITTGTAEDGRELTPEELDNLRRQAATRETLRKAKLLAEGPAGGSVPDPLDPKHMQEGVVLRIEAVAGRGEHMACKLKAHDFGVAEGYVKDAGVRDIEEDDADDDT